MIFDTVTLAVRLILAGVFIVSGVGKLRAPGSVADAVKALSLPSALGRGVVAQAFPWCEIALGAALLLTPRPWVIVPAAAALLLSLAFAVVVARAVRSGSEASCHCFGAGESAMSWWTVGRNAALVLAAAALMLEHPPVAVTALVLAALGFCLAASEFSGKKSSSSSSGEAVMAAPASTPEIYEEDEYVRRPNPAVVLNRLTGEPGIVPSVDLYLRGPSIVLYVSDSCGSCRGVLAMEPELRRIAGDMRIVYLFGPQTESVPEAWAHSELEMFSDKEGLFTFISGIQGTPALVLLGADGLMAAGPEYGEDAIMETVKEIAAVLAEAD